jgi:hypothetical protein
MAGLSASLDASVLILCGAVNALLSKVGVWLARTAYLQTLCPVLLLLLLPGTSATAADSYTQ